VCDWKTTTGNFPVDIWERAKEQCRQYLIGIAKAGRLTDYLTTATSFQHIINYHHRNSCFFSMLGQISLAEHRAGRPLLSCLVAHSEHDDIGVGFFGAAEECGFEIDDEDKFWCDEVRRTHDYWRGK
jgi:hypothetical protein